MHKPSARCLRCKLGHVSLSPDNDLSCSSCGEVFYYWPTRGQWISPRGLTYKPIPLPQVNPHPLMNIHIGLITPAYTPPKKLTNITFIMPVLGRQRDCVLSVVA